MTKLLITAHDTHGKPTPIHKHMLLPGDPTRIPEGVYTALRHMVFGELDPADSHILDKAAEAGCNDICYWLELVPENDPTTHYDWGEIWQKDLAKDYLAELVGNDESTIALARKIRSLDQWDPDLCTALCKAAYMDDDLAAAAPEDAEAVVLAAAEKLGVDLF